MVKKCCVKSCKSESYGGTGISFHSFPKIDEATQKWLDAIPMSPKITKNSVVCSLHFSPAEFYIRNSRANAVPSVFPVTKNKQVAVLSDVKLPQHIFNLIFFWMSRIISDVNQCITDEKPHELQLVKALANSYLNLRMFHHAKRNALRNLGTKIGLRQKLHKTILFSHV